MNKNIKIGFKVEGKNRKRRATFAMRALKREMLKHLRTTEYVLDNSVNNFIWARGKAESPNQVELTIIGDKNPKVFLANSKELKEFLEGTKEKKEVKEVKDTKAESKVIPKEPKKEVKEEKKEKEIKEKVTPKPKEEKKKN